MNNEYLNNNNKVFLQGEVVGDVELSHEVKGEKFYTFNLKVPRSSGVFDVLPIMISEKLLTNSRIKNGEFVAIRGQFRSHNMTNDGAKSHLVLSVYCREVCDWDETLNPNVLELCGYICKPPIYRTTPFGRQIADLLIAVNRNYNKSDYIPCIAWGQNAIYASGLEVGKAVTLTGRIQSREYCKFVEGSDEPLQKIAYEVSISKLGN